MFIFCVNPANNAGYHSEMRKLFETIRNLVEKRYRIRDTQQEKNRELPWQSVSAFCFLRFIVPAILHPHLFGLCPGIHVSHEDQHAV
jgi:hypothetical protein